MKTKGALLNHALRVPAEQVPNQPILAEYRALELNETVELI